MSDFKKNPQYKPVEPIQVAGYFVEEGGEMMEALGRTMAALGKSMRWGLDGVNPELPPEQKETNAAWLLRELGDLEQAVELLREHVESNKGEHDAS